MKSSWDQDAMTLPRLVLTAEDNEFDPTTIQHWQEEGFEVAYLPFRGQRKAYVRDIERLPDELELGEKYAIVGQSRELPRK